MKTQIWKVKHGLFIGSNGKKDAFLDATIRKVYRAWRSIKTRCYNPNSKAYKDYGGRGIVMCDKWHYDFIAFWKDIGSPPSATHSVGRIDNDGNYTPKNCHWETSAEQMANRRTTVFVTINGETLCAAEWARRIGITANGFRARLKQGRTGESLLLPRRQGRRAA